MNIEKTIKSLEKNRFKVTYFEQAETVKLSALEIPSP